MTALTKALTASQLSKIEKSRGTDVSSHLLLHVPRTSGSSFSKPEDYREQTAAWRRANKTLKELSRTLSGLGSEVGFNDACTVLQWQRDLPRTYRSAGATRYEGLESKINSLLATYKSKGLEDMGDHFGSLRELIQRTGDTNRITVPTDITIQTGAQPYIEDASRATKALRMLPFASKTAGEGPTESDWKIWKEGSTTAAETTGALLQSLRADQGWGSTIASGLWQAATLLPNTFSTLKNVTQSFGARYAEERWDWMGDHEMDNTGSWYDQVWTRLQGQVPEEWNWADQTKISVKDFESLHTFASNFRPTTVTAS